MKKTEDIHTELSQFKRTKLFKNVSGWLGAGLYISGIFTSLSGALSEAELITIVEEFGKTSTYYSGEIFLKNNVISSNDNQSGTTDVIAGYVTFDTSETFSVLESSGCRSITDNGVENFSINFTEPLGNYVYTVITSEPAKVLSASMDSNMLNLIFDRPLFGIIKVLFFEKIITIE